MRSPLFRNTFQITTHLFTIRAFVSLDFEGVEELHGAECKINLAITESFVVSDTLGVEVNLSSDSSSNSCSSRGDGRDNVSRDHLSLVAVSFSDVVVSSA